MDDTNDAGVVTIRAAQYVRMSTEHQKYSTENQADAIQIYAERHGMEIVQTYSDAGKSGLNIEGRDGLKQLISDVEAGTTEFDVILVYDISRWGRFQDADESAYYEYICRRQGVSIHYCAEQFENDGSPVSTIVKGVKRAMAGESVADATPEGLPSMRLWRISDPSDIESVTSALADTQLYMADGHHRYETALTYLEEVRAERTVGPDEAVNFRLMTLISVDDPGLLLLGYHRLLENATDDELARFREYVNGAFDLEDRGPIDPSSVTDLEKALNAMPQDQVVIGFAGIEPGRLQIGVMRSPADAVDELQASDYVRLHEEVVRSTFALDREQAVIAFEHNAAAVLRSVAGGAAQVGFVMRAVPIGPFETIVKRGQRLPSKSTYFHPKLHTGAVIQSLKGDL